MSKHTKKYAMQLENNELGTVPGNQVLYTDMHRAVTPAPADHVLRGSSVVRESHDVRRGILRRTFAQLQAAARREQDLIDDYFDTPLEERHMAHSPLLQKQSQKYQRDAQTLRERVHALLR